MQKQQEQKYNNNKTIECLKTTTIKKHKYQILKNYQISKLKLTNLKFPLLYGT